MPATEDRVRTRVITSQGEMAFQEYFVKHRCEPHFYGGALRGDRGGETRLAAGLAYCEDAAGRVSMWCWAHQILF